jgi:hypothetical protein
VNVLITLALIVILAMWATTVYSRLARLKHGVKEAWQRLETDKGNSALRKVYNERVGKYNAALEAFPAYLIAPLTGLSPARRFE